MSFSFGVFSERADPVYASGYGSALALGDAAYADITFTEDTDSNNAYDGTTFTCPSNSSGVYLITVMCTRTSRTSAVVNFTVAINGVDDTTREAYLNTGDATANAVGAVYQRVVSLVVGNTVVVRGKSSDAASTMSNASFVIRRL